jgi:hypothetical protein
LLERDRQQVAPRAGLARVLARLPVAPTPLVEAGPSRPQQATGDTCNTLPSSYLQHVCAVESRGNTPDKQLGASQVTANINRFKFTESSVAKFCVPPAEGELTPTGKPLTERLYWDTEVRGFGVIARANSSSFIVLRDVNRRPVKVTIGRLGAYTVTEAKDIAREHIHAMRNGINPNQAREEKRLAAEKAREEGVTLKGAVAIHVADMRAEQRAAESIDFIENVFLRLYVPELANRPLASLSRIACRELHAKLSTERGPATANRVLKTLRAVWRSAARVYESLPTAPTIAVKFHKMKRRRAPIAWANLPSWWATVESLKNPVRRDLQRLLLFTGLRSTDGKTIRWEHIDFEAGTLHRPKPKGGEDRAFTIPLLPRARHAQAPQGGERAALPRLALGVPRAPPQATRLTHRRSR